jgi:hypothetical protein
MAVFKEITANDIKTARSFLNQLVDVIEEDISGSVTRRKYQVFVTGGVGPGVTSSIFQTVYDQDFSLQTANPMFDMTVGCYISASSVLTASSGRDTAGKYLFPSQSVMMREKIDTYRQYGQTLLGSADTYFTAPLNSTTTSDRIDHALFLSFKRLFARDQIRRETFAMRFFQSASRGGGATGGDEESRADTGPNLYRATTSGSVIFTDVGSAVNKEVTYGGQVSNIVDSANTSRTVGLLFNDRGIVVLDIAKIISGSQKVSGAIDAVTSITPTGGILGQDIIGGQASANPRATFIPDLMMSASIDDILEHFASVRFGSGSNTAVTFQNVTNINSTLIFCRATADEFNYSSNPTYVDTDNRIVVIDSGQEDTQKGFTFITTVGLYDSNDNLLAVAKLSRPVEKNDEKDLTLRIRLDY